MYAPRERRQVDQRAHGQLPRRAIDRTQRLGNIRNALHRAVGQLDLIADLVGPQPELLQLLDQIAVHLQEIARQGLALEQIGNLRLDALVAARDRRDGGGRRDRDQQAVAQAVRFDFIAQRIPLRHVRRRDTPAIELQLALRGPRVLERIVRPSSRASSIEVRSAWK